jgi:outer membrane protein
VLGRVAFRSTRAATNTSLIRQAKETLGQRRIELDVQRDLVRQNVVQFWSLLQATKAQIISAQAPSPQRGRPQRRARGGAGRPAHHARRAQRAAGAGQCARLAGDRRSATGWWRPYTLLAAVGRLSPEVMGLKTEIYDARVHYHQVRDKWIGVRTPDGR